MAGYRNPVEKGGPAKKAAPAMKKPVAKKVARGGVKGVAKKGAASSRGFGAVMRKEAAAKVAKKRGAK